MTRRPVRHRALTLLEVVISIALIGLLLGTLTTFFWQTTETRRVAGASAARTQLVQQVLGRIAADLRESVAPDAFVVDSTPIFVGTRRSITFLTAPLPAPDTYRIWRTGDPVPLPHHDLRELTYQLWIDPEKKTDDGQPVIGGILRTERPLIEPAVPIDQLPEEEAARYVRHDLWTYELGYLEFRYFDGVEWSTTWEVTQGNPLPHLVQITVGFESLTQDELDDKDLNDYPLTEYPLGPDVPRPDRYAVTVRLPGADETFSARLYKLSDEVKEVYELPGTAAGGGTASPGGGR